MPVDTASLPVIRFLQVNLNHCWTAQQLLAQTAIERKTDVILVSDYNRPLGGQQWIASSDGKCGVHIPSRSSIRATDMGYGNGFAWVRAANTLMYSCYCTPNCPLDAFDYFLTELEYSIRDHAKSHELLVVAGDFNSHSAEWGSSSEDARGELLSNFASALNLTVCNVGTTPTFRRINAESVIDVTFARPPTGNCTQIGDWSVLEGYYSASDHEYIEFTAGNYQANPQNHRTDRGVPIKGWSVKKLSTESLHEFWNSAGPQATSSSSAEAKAESLHYFLSEACDAAMPRRTVVPGKKAAHWWNNDIAALRKSTIAARRRYQRAGRRAHMVGREEVFREYNDLRKQLRQSIRKAQEASWKQLCDLVDQDPWGVPYRIVMKRLGRKSPPIDTSQALAISRGLFPAPPSTDWAFIPIDYAPLDLDTIDVDQPIPPITVEELRLAVRKLPNNKAPGPDHVPNEMIRLAANRFPDLFLSVFNACLTEGSFPNRWKMARLVLLHKGQDKPIDVPSSYRPISLLDGVGKLLERLILTRLETLIDQSGAVSKKQYGFRRGRSTIDAISEVIKTAQDAGRGAVQHRDLCAVITLDVRNAFNSAPWPIIDSSLRKAMVPKYLIKILRSYMKDRYLLIGDSTERATSLPVLCGVPQGSVLGPTLWNTFYDAVLKLDVPKGVKLIAFADDLAVVAVARTTELIEYLVNPVLSDIDQWMSDNGLSLAPDKSECIIITKKKSFRDPMLSVSGTQIRVKRTIRYLGVHLDTRLSFVEHAKAVATGARKAATSLARLMPNVGGPSHSRRSLLMSVVHSRLLYGSQVWTNEVNRTNKAKLLLTQPQRLAAIRVARCYRSVSDVASLVLARMPPVFLLAQERHRIAELKKAGTKFCRYDQRMATVEQWQIVWDAETTKAAWTKRLIPDIRIWWRHGLKSVSFHMAQVLSGHGCFQKYLWSKARTPSPACKHCNDPYDTAEHTVFDCAFWEDKRETVISLLGRRVVPEDVSEILCGPDTAVLPIDKLTRCQVLATAEKIKKAFTQMVEEIMGQKETLERERQAVEYQPRRV